MTRRTRRRRKTPVQVISIAFGGGAKRSSGKGWRHSLGVRSGASFRRLFAVAAGLLFAGASMLAFA